MRKKPREKPPKTRWTKARLEDLIHRATLDAQDDEEQQMGFYTAIEENVKFPFKAEVGRREVSVQGIGVGPEDEIVAVCVDVRSRERHSVPLLDLPMPKPPPKGAEWIEAYRLWLTE